MTVLNALENGRVQTVESVRLVTVLLITHRNSFTVEQVTIVHVGFVLNVCFGPCFWVVLR